MPRIEINESVQGPLINTHISFEFLRRTTEGLGEPALATLDDMQIVHDSRQDHTSLRSEAFIPDTGLQMDLTQYCIPGSQEAFYIPNFVSEEEEQYIIRKITESPQPKWKRLPNRRLQIWGGELTAKNVLLPQTFPPYITEYPDIVARIKATGAFRDSPHGQPNHAIMNEYLPGQGIMAHEDGPSYHPVVATLSLGSHAVFHYYRYAHESEAPVQDPGTENNGKGQSIEGTPVMSVFLEPRSLIITTRALYTSHLHGIDNLNIDSFSSFVPGGPEPSNTPIANLDLISDACVRETIIKGGSLERKVRYSVTCRDVERVSNRVFAIGRK